jgi:LuxR family transcriptional regulator, maltose regulon positive regulatory protein
LPAAEATRRGGRHAQPKNMSPTKLVEPRLPAGYVVRPRLHELLTDGVDHLVTVLSAHAGTGKTVLLGSWARGRRDVAWLTLDRDDNWSPRFWRGVDLALDRVDSRRSTKSANATGEDPAFRIGERIAGLRRPVILVLDDFHEIESPIVLREVDTLLANAPSTLRLVLATRSDPHLRLQRLRLAGDFAEIRAADLAFAPDECRELLDEAGEELSDDEVRRLWERTEGWAAGVRLAALSLEHEPDPSNFVAHFAGDERAVADYLLTEILDRQPADRREFLLRTCVPESLSAELAANLSGNRSAGRLLGELESENFFVSRHDEAGDVYRLHALLRDFLRANLAAARPEELKLLNRRCARWYWEHGEVDLAFRHAVAGEDWDLADDLTAEAWHIVVFGVDARPWDASTSIPAAALVGRPALALRGAAAMLAMGDRVSAEACFEGAVAELRSWPAERRAMVAPLLVAFRIGLARLDSDYAAMRELGLELLAVPRAGAFEVGRRVGAQRAIAATVIGAAQLAFGEFDDAEVSLERSLAQAREVGIDIVTLNSLSELALLEAARGRLRRAVAYGIDAVEYAERRGWSQLHHLSGARLALAWAY